MLKYIKIDLFLKLSFGEDFSGLSETPEEKIKRELDELKKQLNTKGFLEKLKLEVSNGGNLENKQYFEITGKIKSIEDQLNGLKNTSEDARKNLTKLLNEVKNTLDTSLKVIDKKELKSMSNRDFLQMNFDERLKYITKGTVNYRDVANGNQKLLEFNFTFDGVLNRDLYSKTTAGQVLPPEVLSVNIGGEVYSRVGLYGEFFTTSNKRLVIHDGTQIEVTKLRGEKEVAEIKQKNEEIAQEYLKNEPTSTKEIISGAIDIGIDPKFAIIAFEDNYKSTPDADKKVVLEDMFTEFDRYRGSFGYKNELVDGKYNKKLVIGILSQFNKNSWESKATQYGITQKDIEDFKSDGSIYMSNSSNEIQNEDSLPDGTYKKGENLLKDGQFLSKLNQVCSNIGANRDDLIKLMKAESGLDSRVINKQSNATGLIQFMPKTAEGLGTTVGKLRKMSAVEQLDYVEKYFLQNSRGSKLDNMVNLYKVVFFPASLGKDKSWVFSSSDASAGKVAQQNSVISKFSTRPDGFIDGDCFEKYVNEHVSKFTA